jgi:hypothetical protein
MERQRIEIAIVGAKLSPEDVPVGLLTTVLSHLEKAILGYVRADLSIRPDEALTLSLVDIRQGSECLVFSMPDVLVPVIAGMARSLSLGDYASLPSPTYGELHQLSETVAARGWGIEIRDQPEHGIRQVRFGAENPLPPPAKPARIQGTTTVYGRCLRVGGATQPKAEIRLAATGKLLNVDLSEEVAKELAPRLYDDVVLEGHAIWNAESWEIEVFRVSRITEFRRTDPDLAFKELAEAARGRWEGVEAAKYVHTLRADD